MYENEILAVYRFAGIRRFPVDLTAIIESVGYRIKTYQEVAENHEQLIRMKKISGDAYLIRKNKTIYLNDAVPYPGRKRFSIAHELGHIILVTDDEDTVNEFASNLLAPRPIIFARQLKSAAQIASAFGISMSAAGNAAISAFYTPDEKGFEIIDYFGERFSCPWPHNTVIPMARPAAEKPAVRQPEAETRKAGTRRTTRAAARRKKEIEEYHQFVEWRMETDPEFRRTHTIF